MRAYGVKNPVEEKAARIKAIDDSADKRYYPQTKDGVFDEWAAVAKNQYETATYQHNNNQKQRRAMMETQFGQQNFIKDQFAKKQQRKLDKLEGADERKETD